MPQRKSLMTPQQCRAARTLAELTQATLAKAAGLGISTVADFELQRREVSTEAVTRIVEALAAFGVELTNGKRPGVRLRG
jgi:transcriptional regulator with XRE-family HTH domain